MPPRIHAASAAIAISVVLAACAADRPDTYDALGPGTSPSVTSPGSVASTTTVDARNTQAPTSAVLTTDVAITQPGPPAGIVSASPFQYRLDWAAGIFQVRLHNDSPEPITIVGVQFVWAGLTTPVTERHDTLPSGLILDFPVHIAPAVCFGDGLVDDMPSLSTAVIHLQLDDGSAIDAPVFDANGVAEQLYLDDCERQMIEAQVTIEWADLHDEELDGRIVTGGGLRLARRDSTSKVTLLSVSNTVLFTVVTLETGPDEPIVTLEVDDDGVVASVRLIENRCDSHARAESSQSFRFFAQVDLGGGDVHQYTVVPPPDEQTKMRARLEAGCAVLGTTGFVGQDDG